MQRLIVLLASGAMLFAAVSVAAPSGDTWRRHRAERFSVELPASWADAGNERGKILAAARRLAKDDPELAATLNGLLNANEANLAVKMIAFDLDRASLRSGFATNLNVVREQTRLSLREWSAAALKSLSSTSFVRQPIWSRTVRLPGGRAKRFSYRARFAIGGQRREFALVQYSFVRDGAAYVFTYTTLPKRSARYDATFERSARSIRFR